MNFMLEHSDNKINRIEDTFFMKKGGYPSNEKFIC